MTTSGSGGKSATSPGTGGASTGSGGSTGSGTGGMDAVGTGGSGSPGSGGDTTTGSGGASSTGSGGSSSTGTAGSASGTGGSASGTGGSSSGTGGSNLGGHSGGNPGTGGSGTGTPDAGLPPDPFAVAPTCTSKTTWNGGNEGSGNMNPGKACIACHKSSGEAPGFSIAGTLYPTAHEPDLCNGTTGSGNAQIVITGADGKTLTLKPNSAGNFYSGTAVKLPYQAKVLYNGQTRAMAASQSTGDCNSCHTQNGMNAAPGRILLP